MVSVMKKKMKQGERLGDVWEGVIKEGLSEGVMLEQRMRK